MATQVPLMKGWFIAPNGYLVPSLREWSYYRSITLPVWFSFSILLILDFAWTQLNSFGLPYWINIFDFEFALVLGRLSPPSGVQLQINNYLDLETYNHYVLDILSPPSFFLFIHYALFNALFNNNTLINLIPLARESSCWNHLWVRFPYCFWQRGRSLQVNCPWQIRSLGVEIIAEVGTNRECFWLSEQANACVIVRHR